MSKRKYRIKWRLKNAPPDDDEALRRNLAGTAEEFENWFDAWNLAYNLNDWHPHIHHSIETIEVNDEKE